MCKFPLLFCIIKEFDRNMVTPICVLGRGGGGGGGRREKKSCSTKKIHRSFFKNPSTCVQLAGLLYVT